MTVTTAVSSTPVSTRQTPRIILTAGPITIELTEDPADVLAVQRLRFRVFADEPGFSDVIGDPVSQRDADQFDVHCEHLVARHVDEGIIGCARLLPPPRAIAAGGWYTATEFDVEELTPIRSETVEMGRACVDARYRDGAVTSLLWTAVLDYLTTSGYRYMLGCVSVPIGAAGQRGVGLRGTRDLLRSRHQAPWQVYPQVRAVIDGRTLDEIEPPASEPMPPLLRGYLRLGAQVCGEPALDEIFDVGDFVIVLDKERMNCRYLERMSATIRRLAAQQTAPTSVGATK